MSVGSISSTPAVVAVPKQATRPAEEPAATLPVDKVSISPQAASMAAGDADHDGDSR